MNPATDLPFRVRLYGGRNVHGARSINGGPDRVTGCDWFIGSDAVNHWLPDETDITCAGCARAADAPHG